VGVLCGRAQFMQRYREDRPADVCFARGTFNSHPYVMGAMSEFLAKLDTYWVRSIYRNLDIWEARAQALNLRLAAQHLPVRSRICRASGPSTTCNRRAIIGCFNTICAPPDWP